MNDDFRIASRNEMIVSTLLFMIGTVIFVSASMRLSTRGILGGGEGDADDEDYYYNELIDKVNQMPKEEVLRLRRKYFSTTLSVSYNITTPLMITKGRGCYLYDKDGIFGDNDSQQRPYLDTRNNVAHVGHCHPVLVQVVQEQISLINTNTRYLHPMTTILAQKLLATFPKPSPAQTNNEQELTKVFFCNSGSEANDLALRLTRAYMILQQQKKQPQQQLNPPQNNHHHSCPYINLIVVDHAYHGHTIATLDVSPYKFTHSSEYSNGSSTRPSHASRTNINNRNYPDQDDEAVAATLRMHELPLLLSSQQLHDKSLYRTRPTFHIQSVPCPNIYRGLYNKNPTFGGTLNETRGCHPGKLYAQHVEDICRQNQQNSKDNHDCLGTAFMMESGMSVGGVILPPKNYIYHAVHAVRSIGGLYIADEIQTGLGRYGTNFYWGFQYNTDDDHNTAEEHNSTDEPQYMNPIPDIVTVGKGFGNGMPIAAVVCNEKVNAAFEELLGNVEVFNTFGGNPVCASAAFMVLNIIEREQLRKNATIVGAYLIRQLQLLQQQETLFIGDVRGCGLFIGIEFVLDSTSKLPATKLVSWLCSTMKDTYRVLTSIDGPHNNVLVLKPPMVFSIKDADAFLSSLQNALLVDLPSYMDQHPDSTILQPTNSDSDCMDHTPT